MSFGIYIKTCVTYVALATSIKGDVDVFSYSFIVLLVPIVIVTTSIWVV